MKIMVLGGAGKMGCISVQYLAGDSRVEKVIIADSNLENANIVAQYINSPKVEIQEIDLKDTNLSLGLGNSRRLSECDSILYKSYRDGCMSENRHPLYRHGWAVPYHHETTKIT